MNRYQLRPWSLWTANSDKKYMELNGAALIVNKPCDFLENSFPKISKGRKWKIVVTFYRIISYPKYVDSFLNFSKNGIS